MTMTSQKMANYTKEPIQNWLNALLETLKKEENEQ